MLGALDLLEAERTRTYAALLDQGQESLAFQARVAWLEEQLRGLYRTAIQQSRKELSVSEIFELWDKMVSICDFFIDHVRILAGKAPCEVSYDGLLDLRLSCDDKREFHRC
jgi:hypothetical protein